MSFALDMRSMASEMLAEFDERTTKAKLRVVTNGAWNPAIGENDPQTVVDTDLTGVATSYSKVLINGSSIQAGDVKFVCTYSPTPTMKDKVLLDGFEYGIVSITPSAFTGIDLVISYELQLRK